MSGAPTAAVTGAVVQHHPSKGRGSRGLVTDHEAPNPDPGPPIKSTDGCTPVARRLGQPAKFSERLAYSHRIDPLKSWVIEYRKQFRTIRVQHWRRFRTHHPYNPRFPDDVILPTIRHFK
jgi:hypothetical protein